MVENKIKIKIILTVSFVLATGFVFSGKALADCATGQCRTACLDTEKATGESCSFSAGEYNQEGSCCVVKSGSDLTSGKVCSEDKGMVAGRCYVGISCYNVGPSLALGSRGTMGCPSDQICCKTQEYQDATQGKPETPSGGAAGATGGAGGAAVGGASGTGTGYNNQEKIPGFGQTSDFPTYMKQIVNFLFATIGILAMFMLMIGAYQYLMTAGNIAKEENAKTTISSAISGLILGLIAYLLLYTINPDLVAFKLDSVTGGLTGTSGSPSAGTGTGGAVSSGSPGTGSGKCEPVASGPCSESSLGSSCFGSNSYQASSICNAESGGGAGTLSKTDITADGRSFSVGLFQINLTVHDVGGLNCPSAFSGKNYSATVVNESLYQQCVQAAQDPAKNTAKACAIGKNGSSWKPWGANKKCGF